MKPHKSQAMSEQISDECETRILSYVSRAFAERCLAVADFVGFHSLQSTSFYIFSLLFLTEGLLAWEFKATPEQEKGAATIQQACERSYHASFSIEKKLNQFKALPNVTKVIHYRQPSPKGTIRRRMEYYDVQGKPRFTFIQNEDGQFAIDEKTGKIAEGGVFLPLFILEPIFTAPYSIELKYSDYTTNQYQFETRPCTRLTVSIPIAIQDNMGYLITLCGFPTDDKKTFQKIHSYTREYIIDNETGIILGLNRYNYHKQPIAMANLSHFIPAAKWEINNLFDTPKKIDFHVANTSQFLIAIAQKRTNLITVPSLFQKLIWFSDHHRRGLQLIFIIIGVLGLTIVFIKRFRSTVIR